MNTINFIVLLLISVSLIFSVSMTIYSYCRIYTIRGKRIEVLEKIIELNDEKISGMDKRIKSLSNQLEVSNEIRSYGKP